MGLGYIFLKAAWPEAHAARCEDQGSGLNATFSMNPSPQRIPFICPLLRTPGVRAPPSGSDLPLLGGTHHYTCPAHIHASARIPLQAGPLVLLLPRAPRAQFTCTPVGPVPTPPPISTCPYLRLPTAQSQVYLSSVIQEQWPCAGRQDAWVPGPPEPDTPYSHSSKESLPSGLHIPIL